MNYDDTPSPGRPHIRGVLLPMICEVCGCAGTAFHASTTPGPAGTATALPYLRCPDCHGLYQYNHLEKRWDGIIGNPAAGIGFVPLADLLVSMAQ
jgi:hypothetical protein